MKKLLPATALAALTATSALAEIHCQWDEDSIVVLGDYGLFQASSGNPVVVHCHRGTKISEQLEGDSILTCQNDSPGAGFRFIYLIEPEQVTLVLTGPSGSVGVVYEAVCSGFEL